MRAAIGLDRSSVTRRPWGSAARCDELEPGACVVASLRDPFVGLPRCRRLLAGAGMGMGRSTGVASSAAKGLSLLLRVAGLGSAESASRITLSALGERCIAADGDAPWRYPWRR
ncbi:MAG: hypothetical protein JHC40_12300 [Burkholderiales bacterium]|jgi:hypothetical protein|nr:hypothetical protein [Burkholderiales bacterium]